jgi:hypothetical protein
VYTTMEHFIVLRALVGFLGEKSQYNWWDCNFLNETGLKFLDIIFPRSAFAAGVNSVTEAARRLHDERIGKGGVYHLFRLPPAMEQKIHEHLSRFDHRDLLKHLQTKDAAIQKLQAYTNSDLQISEGPIQIGTSKDLFQSSIIKTLAKHYTDAFIKSAQTFPYFMATRDG